MPALMVALLLCTPRLLCGQRTHGTAALKQIKHPATFQRRNIDDKIGGEADAAEAGPSVFTSEPFACVEVSTQAAPTQQKMDVNQP